MRLITRILPLMLLASLLSGCGYNAIQQKDEAVKASWSEVINQYKRRADLVPNLVQTVKGVASQEERELTEVTNARSRVGQINVNADDEASLKQFQQAQGELGSALSRLLVVTENYPQLKSDQNFRDLQAQLEGTENRVTVARGRDHRQDLRLQDQAELHRGQRSADLQRAGGRFRQRAAAAAGTAAGPLTDAPGHCAAGPAAVAATGVAGAAVGADSGAGFAGGRYHRHAGYRAAAGAGAAGD
ncbi:hypothetical protein G6F50_013788 [Rhizopus delemar]|uniref:LemA protein n=1 Tax=Rhizopus delemar TaxID=936053 RepID=A0A9P6YCS1_9FUNG|nr:hypothetical protein G6F50_013788 [Rhizopus delemar]